MVFAARWRLNITGARYNNSEGGQEFGKTGQVYLLDPKEKRDLKQVIEARIRQLARSTDLVVVNQIPEVGINILNWYHNSSELLTHSYTEYQRQNDPINLIFTNIEGLKIIHADKLVCSETTQRCSTKLESGALLYYDDDHPSVHFSTLIAEQIVPLYFGDQD